MASLRESYIEKVEMAERRDPRQWFYDKYRDGPRPELSAQAVKKNPLLAQYIDQHRDGYFYNPATDSWQWKVNELQNPSR